MAFGCAETPSWSSSQRRARRRGPCRPASCAHACGLRSQMFDRVAPKYDTVNLLISLGQVRACGCVAALRLCSARRALVLRAALRCALTRSARRRRCGACWRSASCRASSAATPRCWTSAAVRSRCEPLLQLLLTAPGPGTGWVTWFLGARYGCAGVEGLDCSPESECPVFAIAAHLRVLTRVRYPFCVSQCCARRPRGTPGGASRAVTRALCRTPTLRSTLSPQSSRFAISRTLQPACAKWCACCAREGHF